TCEHGKSCSSSTTGRVARFFFSSRRRHTRFSRDWSSDVCSSDLLEPEDAVQLSLFEQDGPSELRPLDSGGTPVPAEVRRLVPARSEERRVGSGGRVSGLGAG